MLDILRTIRRVEAETETLAEEKSVVDDAFDGDRTRFLDAERVEEEKRHRRRRQIAERSEQIQMARILSDEAKSRRDFEIQRSKGQLESLEEECEAVQRRLRGRLHEKSDIDAELALRQAALKAVEEDIEFAKRKFEAKKDRLENIDALIYDVEAIQKNTDATLDGMESLFLECDRVRQEATEAMRKVEAAEVATRKTVVEAKAEIEVKSDVTFMEANRLEHCVKRVKAKLAQKSAELEAKRQVCAAQKTEMKRLEKDVEKWKETTRKVGEAKFKMKKYLFVSKAA